MNDLKKFLIAERKRMDRWFFWRKRNAGRLAAIDAAIEKMDKFLGAQAEARGEAPKDVLKIVIEHQDPMSVHGAGLVKSGYYLHQQELLPDGKTYRTTYYNYK